MRQRREGGVYLGHVHRPSHLEAARDGHGVGVLDRVVLGVDLERRTRRQFLSDKHVHAQSARDLAAV